MICTCTEPGFCPVLERMMVEHHFQICRGEVLTPEKCERYRANWLALKNRPPAVEGDVPAPPGDFHGCCDPPV